METLYDKILNEVQLYLCFSEMQEDSTNLTKAVKRVAIQAQIDLLKSQNERLHKQRIEVKALTQTLISEYENYRLKGKIEGIRLAIENNRQEIQELEKKLS